ncbi:TctA family transporter [Amaricoccus macauensis]|uniref:TctA family transporter n=1 Tax=Amaricoccus macauensis TaxID=57001 RepID=A0A840SHW8_9RHOB|nr:tripartite tricarboxylate transporter permease [Amaricoccus macauensis]MBB5220275.1 TctA family transporter [Amaricoccus macauensis]
MDAIALAAGLVFRVDVLVTLLLASAFGLFVGAIPGLTATMAMALLVPLTFFMDPIPAVGAMVTASAMAIFAGDIPSTLLRIPGTPASAAYTEEAYRMTLKGEAETAMAANLLFSAFGGLVGTAVLILTAPYLAEIALKFSAPEYFWMATLGLTCAAFIGSGRPVKGILSLLIGLLVATVGLDNPAAVPRFTFGSTELLGGVDFIAAMIGLFAISEVLRNATQGMASQTLPQVRLGNPLRGWGPMFRKYWPQQVQGNVVGVAVGALPGAGADLAAWIAYAVSRRLSKHPEKYGTGNLEGIVAAGSANNSALGSAWVPALVFGIPGDTITAIVIGVLFLHGLNPGPTLFIFQPENIYAVFIIFILANILMVPLGYAAIMMSRPILKMPRRVLMPLILAFCVVGAFASNNAVFNVGVMLAFGVLGFFMEENGIPLAPCILGIVLGGMVEDNFITTMIRNDGNLLAFFERPIAAGLGVATLLIWSSPLILGLLRRRRAAA